MIIFIYCRKNNILPLKKTNSGKMEQKNKVYYWIVTGIFSLIMLMTIYNFIFNYEDTRASFSTLGISSVIIYPLAMAKILGLIAIWTRRFRLIKEWAYAGFFFDFILALILHINVSDGYWYLSVIALVFLIASYWFDYEAFTEK